MSGPGDALFDRRGAVFVPTRFTQGPWDPHAQFGGSPAALLATLVDETPSLVPMQVARFTLDLLRPVPLGPLTSRVRVVREGKRIQVVAAELLFEGTEVARVTALRLRRVDLGDVTLPDGLVANPVPLAARPVDDEPFPERPPGSRRAVEYLFEGVGGYYGGPAWLRLAVGVVSGQEVRPLARLAYTADLASGIGQPRRLPLRGINADLTLNVLRYPQGEWLALDGTGWTSRDGIGQVQATLSDTRGVVATVSMTRLVDPPSR